MRKSDEATQCWRTDPGLFAYLHERYRFTVDGAASAENALLPRYWTDFEAQHWKGERVFMNPPFALSSRALFVAATRFAFDADLICMLVLAKTCGKAIAEAVTAGASIEVFSRRVQYLLPSGKVPTRSGRVTSFDRDSMLVLIGRDHDRSRLAVCAYEPRTPSELAAEYGTEERT